MIVVLKVQCLATIKNLSIQVGRFNKNKNGPSSPLETESASESARLTASVVVTPTAWLFVADPTLEQSTQQNQTSSPTILTVFIVGDLDGSLSTGEAVELPKTLLARSSLQLGSGWQDTADQVR